MALWVLISWLIHCGNLSDGQISLCPRHVLLELLPRTLTFVKKIQFRGFLPLAIGNESVVKVKVLKSWFNWSGLRRIATRVDVAQNADCSFVFAVEIRPQTTDELNVSNDCHMLSGARWWILRFLAMKPRSPWTEVGNFLRHVGEQLGGFVTKLQEGAGAWGSLS